MHGVASAPAAGRPHHTTRDNHRHQLAVITTLQQAGALLTGQAGLYQCNTSERTDGPRRWPLGHTGVTELQQIHSYTHSLFTEFSSNCQHVTHAPATAVPRLEVNDLTQLHTQSPGNIHRLFTAARVYLITITGYWLHNGSDKLSVKL